MLYGEKPGKICQTNVKRPIRWHGIIYKDVLDFEFMRLDLHSQQ